jgi:hypothetical protein
MRGRARYDLARRLGRLERPSGHRGSGRDSEWLTETEFEEYAELRRSGVPIEATDCQRLLAVARGRRARGEAKGGELWRVDVAEGRPTVIPRLSDEEVDRLAAEWYERNPPRGGLAPPGRRELQLAPRPLTRYTGSSAPLQRFVTRRERRSALLSRMGREVPEPRDPDAYISAASPSWAACRARATGRAGRREPK